jgi:antitoxin (DNA-binding transcriptional repressor) of toxin-antitoxin stability system
LAHGRESERRAACRRHKLMYNVHMKRYSVALVRERLSEALDQAEQGKPVFIERRGVTYELVVRKLPARRKKSAPAIEILDPSLVATGEWTWEWKRGGLKFRARRS